MRKLLIFCWLCVLASLSASAQVSVQIVTDQDLFLGGEDMTLKVRVTNFSGRTLHLGSTPDWLTFEVEALDGDKVVTQLGVVPVEGKFDLESSSVATKRVNIAPYYRLTQQGRYSVTATVRIDEWGKSFASPPKKFDIVSGTTLWESDFGVASRAQTAPEVRRYVLLQSRFGKSTQLYVRVTDATGALTYRVFPVGPLVSFSKPEPAIDQDSHLHLLYQISARGFSYNEVSPQGELLTRQTYDYSDTRPVLASGPDGKVRVRGGVRHVNNTDFPPAAAAVSSDAKTETP